MLFCIISFLFRPWKPLASVRNSEHSTTLALWHFYSGLPSASSAHCCTRTPKWLPRGLMTHLGGAGFPGGASKVGRQLHIRSEGEHPGAEKKKAYHLCLWEE